MIQPRQPNSISSQAHHTATVNVMLVNATAPMQRQIRDVLQHAGVDAEIRNVEGYLHALAQIVTTTPPLVLVGMITGQEPESLQETARALRRAAPQSRLLLLAEPTLEPAARAAVQKGFDGYLVLPLDENEFLSMLPQSLTHPQDARLPQALTDEPTRELVDDEIQQVIALAEKAKSEPAPSENIQNENATQNVVTNSPQDVSSSNNASQEISATNATNTPEIKPTFLPGSQWLGLPLLHPEHAMEIVSDDQLGDSDLLDQLLSCNGSVQSMALRMIAARGSIAGVQCADQIASIPADHVHVPIALGTTEHGFLHAPSPATAEQLKPWAQWLARWFMLEDRQRRLWRMAMHDELTGAWNRRYSDLFLRDILARATEQRFQVTLMLFDIDDFKKYNDQFGHPAGDEILRQTAKLMQSVVRPHDVVARIGGDEFAVIFWDPQGPRKPNSQHPQDVRKAAERFQKAIREHRFPKLGEQAPGPLAISGGLASFPWDGRTPEELIKLADTMAMQAKTQGKNALRFGPGIVG